MNVCARMPTSSLVTPVFPGVAPRPLPAVIRYPARCTNMPQHDPHMTSDTMSLGPDNLSSCHSATNAGTMRAGIVEPAPTVSSVEAAAPPTIHVLAIDDDPSVRQMIADYLGDNDIRVT